MNYTLHPPDDKESQPEPQRGAADAVLAHEGSAHPARARQRCSIRRALEVAGNRSALLIMREAFYGTTRFDDFAGRAGISEPVAATRLRDLVEHGLLRREPYREPGQRTRMAYRLTEMGADLLPVLVALMNWGDRWLADGTPPVAVRHRGCSGPVRAELRCPGDHRLGAADLELAIRSGSGADPGS